MQTEAAKRAKRRYYERNKQRCLERSRAWAQQNKEKRRASCARYLAENPEKRRETTSRYYSQNAERIHATTRDWEKRNPERVQETGRQSYKRNAESRRKQAREYSKANPSKRAALQALRRTRKLKATPPWVDRKAISEIYRMAADLGLTVDHIVPLKGKNVCGLHVPWNLQLLTLSENSSKQNRFDESAVEAVYRQNTSAF